MSAHESAEMAWHLVQFSAGNMPLSRSLRVAAEEAPSRRLARAFRLVADQIERGKSLEEALATARLDRLEPWGRWISAKTSDGHWPGMFTHLMEVSSLSRRLRSMVAKSLVYPLLLFCLTMALLALIGTFLLKDFRDLFTDFGISLPVVTIWLLDLGEVVRRAGVWLFAGPVLAVVASWLTARVLFNPAERARLSYHLPLWGPMMESAGWAEGCHVLAVILEQGRDLPRALEEATPGLSDGNVASVFRRAAEGVREGRSFGEAVAQQAGVPEGFGEFLRWGESHRGLAEALRIGGELFEARARTQARYLARICITLSLAFVSWGIVFVVLGLLLPLLNLLNGLSGSISPGVFPYPLSEIGSVLAANWSYMLAAASVLMVLIVLFAMQRRRRFLARCGPFPRRVEPRKRGKLGLRHLMFWLVPLALMLVFAREAGSGVVIVLLGVILPMWIISRAIGRYPKREAQQDGLARVLAVSARNDLPLGPSVKAYSYVCKGRYRMMVESLGHKLSQGESIQGALSKMPGLLSARAERMIRMGTEVGPEAQTLMEAGRGLEGWRADREAWHGALGYGVLVLSLIGGIGLYGATGLTNTYANILSDFAGNAGSNTVDHPGHTIFQWMSQPLPMIGMSGMAIALLGVMLLAMGLGLLYWRSRKRGISRAADRAVLQRAIGMGLERGSAMAEVLQGMAHAHPDRWWRSRLRRAASGIESGMPWEQPLVQEGLLDRAEAGTLAAAGRFGNVPWAFQELAKLGERREHARTRMQARMIQVGLTMMVGIFVLIYALTYFFPIVWILRQVEEWVP
jgi:type II secretory pathway component PulF